MCIWALNIDTEQIEKLEDVIAKYPEIYNERLPLILFILKIRRYFKILSLMIGF